MTNREEVALVSVDKDLLDVLLCDDRYHVVGVFDPDPDVDCCGVPLLGSDDTWPGWHATRPETKVIMAVDPPYRRKKLAGDFGRDSIVGFVADEARVSRFAEVLNGVIVQRQVAVMAGTRIGFCCKLNTGTRSGERRVGEESRTRGWPYS